MGNRGQSRVKSILPIRIWGMDSLSKPFMELAHTLDVSVTGVRVGGFSALVSQGEMVNVQYRHRKAKFEVAWVGRPGSSRERQIGIKSIDAGKDIFSIGQGAESFIDVFEGLKVEQPRKGKESRRHTRHTLSGGVEIVNVENREGAWAELADISRSGCYVSTLTPLRMSSKLEVVIQLDNDRVHAFGAVRTHHPQVGMGIEFTEFKAPADEKLLQRIISRLEAGSEPPEEKSKLPGPKPDSSMVGKRLKSIARELNDIEQLIQSATVQSEVLEEFREATSRVRTTAWAIQRWMELQESNLSPFPVISYLNTERIRQASRLCNLLYEDLRQHELGDQKKHLDELLENVEKLFTHLAGIDFQVLHPVTKKVVKARVTEPDDDG